MPTYAYRCADCGDSFDIKQSFTDDSLTVCPACGGKLRKQYGSVGVTFKGSGFYRTDSRGSGTKSSSVSAKTSKPSSSSGSGSATSATSKPTGGKGK